MTPSVIPAMKTTGGDRDVKVSLLLLEDDPNFADLVTSIVGEAAPEFIVESVSELREALARLERGPVDIIVTDLDVPDSHGPATVRALRQRAAGVPIIVLSGAVGFGVVDEATSEGALRYLVKGDVSIEGLVAALRVAWHTEDRTEIVT